MMMKRFFYFSAAVLLLTMAGSNLLLSESPLKQSVPLSVKKAESRAVDKKKANDMKPDNRKIVVYYFHGKFRCPSCRKIEAYTEEAVKSYFSSDIENKRLEYYVVDVEEKGMEHFTRDYQLYTKSVVVVDTLKGKQIRWKNLPKVWELLSDKDSFKNYIRDEIRSYQKES